MSQHVRLLSPRYESHVYIYPEQDHQPESRMREIRTSGSEGGGAGYLTGSPYPYQGRPYAGTAFLRANLHAAKSNRNSPSEQTIAGPLGKSTL